MKIKYKAPLLVLGVSIVTSLVGAYSSYAATERVIESAKQRELQTTAVSIQTTLASQLAKASARASIVASLPPVQEAFRAHDRDALVKLLQPAFLAQRNQYGVTEGQFHLAPAISFLRIYAPTVGHDEDLSSFREMVLATNRHHEAQRGVEVGRRGLGIRGVTVIEDAQGPIGSFEVGMSFDSVLSEVKSTTGFDCGVFIDDKLMTRVATQAPKSDAERVIGGFQNVQATNWQALQPLVSPSMLQKGTDITTTLQAVKGVDYGTVLVPVLDYKGANIGAIVAVRAFEEFQSQSRWALAGIVATTCLQVIALAGALLLAINGMLLRPLAALTGALATLTGGGKNPDLAGLERQPDELGELAQHVALVGRTMSLQSAESTVPTAAEVVPHG